ncbi:indolepyruvate oxidoreductase subunit beta family protein [Patulibacter defluvii]|uniref:indolepyruvate oxidoreductase subunit beta family protein n=1 Tax=Patulibacter defluvii TaxID=3095358 RepID=UPI002A75633E|nr:indolepyruvate oxidoreductase subunit beta family protein [Patulibacter sp. DM4]
MSSWSEGRRPLTLAILALGGEGGGVLADWIVSVAEGNGWYAQNTSVAGVAQRTGATVYYVEMFPPAAGGDATGGVRPEPVMSIFPTPGEVDVVVASELMESGRAIQRGFSTADRTTLITSTSRVYSIDEKMAMGDGRVDDAELLAAAARGSKRLVAADFMQMAEDAGSVISASLFGAVAGSGALPFSREAFEAPIRAFGKGVESSLAAFAAGYDEATAPPPAPAAAPVELPMSGWASGSGTTADAGPARPSRALEARKQHREEERRRIAADDPASLVGPGLRPLAERVRELPEASRSMVLHGLVRTAVYQDASYAERYLERVGRFAAADPERDGDARLTREAARHVALWMCFQDIIQVAQQKTRRARMDRIRKEAKAKPDQLLQVHEYLHPQFDELTDSMPSGLAKRVRKSRIVRRIVQAVTRQGMILNTTSVLGYTQLSLLARMRPLRPRTLRFEREQQAIDRWMDLALGAAPLDPELAREIVECQGVLKGYGATYEHGSESFAKLMEAAAELTGQAGAAERLAELRAAALADEHGRELEAKLPKAPAH